MRWRGKDWLPPPDPPPTRVVPLTPQEVATYSDTALCREGGYEPSDWAYYDGNPIPVLRLKKRRVTC